MPKVATMMVPFQAVQGKLQKQSYVVPSGKTWGRRIFYGKVYASGNYGFAFKNKTTDPNSSAQLAHRIAFTNAIKEVNRIMADSTARAPYQAAFVKQTRYFYLRNYIFAQVYVKPE